MPILIEGGLRRGRSRPGPGHRRAGFVRRPDRRRLLRRPADGCSLCRPLRCRGWMALTACETLPMSVDARFMVAASGSTSKLRPRLSAFFRTRADAPFIVAHFGVLRFLLSGVTVRRLPVASAPASKHFMTRSRAQAVGLWSRPGVPASFGASGDGVGACPPLVWTPSVRSTPGSRLARLSSAMASWATRKASLALTPLSRVGRCVNGFALVLYVPVGDSEGAGLGDVDRRRIGHEGEVDALEGAWRPAARSRRRLPRRGCR